MTTTFLERGRMGLRGEWRCEEAAVCSGRNTYDNLRGRSLSPPPPLPPLSSLFDALRFNGRAGRLGEGSKFIQYFECYSTSPSQEEKYTYYVSSYCCMQEYRLIQAFCSSSSSSFLFRTTVKRDYMRI